MPAGDPPVPPFLRVILDAVLVELRSIATLRQQDDRLKLAISNIEAAIRSLGSPTQV